MSNILEIVARGKNETAEMFGQVAGGADKTKDSLKGLHDEAAQGSKTFSVGAGDVAKFAAGFVTAQAAIGAFKAVWGGLVDFVSDGIKEFAEAERAQRLLTVALKNQGGPAQAIARDYAALGKEFQRTTVYSDDLIAEMQSLLIQVGNVMPSQMGRAQTAAADLASGLGIDLRQATMLVGKAFAGETGSLSRFGIIVDETKLKTQGAEAVLDTIQARFGGQAQAEVDTYSGKVAKMANDWGDVKEAVGEVVITSPLVEAFMRVAGGGAQKAGVGADVFRIALDRTMDSLGPFGVRIRQDVTMLTLWAERANDAARAAKLVGSVPIPAMFDPAKNRIVETNNGLALVNETLDAAEAKHKAAAKATEEHTKKLEAIHEALSGAGAIASMKDWVAEVQRVGGVTKLSEDAQEKYNKALTEGISYLNAAGKAVPTQAFADWLKVNKELIPAVTTGLDGILEKLTKIKDATLPAAAVSVKNFAGEIKTGLEGLELIFPKLKTDAQEWNEDLLESAKTTAGALVDIGKDIGGQIGGWFGTILDSALGLMQSLVGRATDASGGLAKFFSSAGGKNLVGGIGLGMQTFGQGYQLGGLTSNRAVGTGIGAGSGAATGAMVGTFIMPGLGTAAGAGIGALAGAIGGWMGANKKKKEEEAALKDLQAELLATFQGMDNLKKVAADVGINIDKAFDMKDRKKAISTIQDFTAALEAKNARLVAVGTAQDLVTQKTAIFAAGLKDATAITDENQAAFDRLGRQFVTTFQAGVRETGDFFGSLANLMPGLDEMAGLQEKLGFKTSDTLGRLLGFRDVIKTNADVGQSIAINTSLMDAYKQANILTRETVLDFAADAVEHNRILKERHVDETQALILQQGELQKLWEANKKYNAITDEGTLALLKQAEAAGIVGEENRSNQDRMLEATIGISTSVRELVALFKNELPNAVAAAGDAIDDTFRDRKYRIPVDFEYSDDYPGGGRPPEAPGYAVGGTVPYTPGGRIVRVAEAGTEHILSTRQLESIAARIAASASGGQTPIAVHVNIGDRHLQTIVNESVNRGLRNGGIRVPSRSVADQVF